MSMNEVIARNISNFLSRQNKKQKDLATALEIPRQTVNKMLNGTRMISAPELCKIAQYLNVSMEELVQQKEGIIYSPLKVFMGEVKTEAGHRGLKIAEKLIDLYSYHYKFQRDEYINKCNQVWTDE